MNFKQIGAGIGAVLLVICALWAFMISAYEDNLGTGNIFTANDSANNLTNERNNSLFELSFSKADENLEWTQLSISIQNMTETMDCSKGNFTSKDIGKAKVSPKLSSDGVTFTVIVDATSEEDFTYVDIDNLIENDETNYDMRFSKTDIYLSDGIIGTIVEDMDFEELSNIPEQDFTVNSDEKLDWYDYKLTTHRIEAEDKIYVINVNGGYYKIKFISYYNGNDEPRYVSFMIGALEDTEFPALSNPDLVSPAKCTIIESGDNSDFWEKQENITIFENDFDICESTCIIKIIITYEGVSVKGTKELQIE